MSGGISEHRVGTDAKPPTPTSILGHRSRGPRPPPHRELSDPGVRLRPRHTESGEGGGSTSPGSSAPSRLRLAGGLIRIQTTHCPRVTSVSLLPEDLYRGRRRRSVGPLVENRKGERVVFPCFLRRSRRVGSTLDRLDPGTSPQPDRLPNPDRLPSPGRLPSLGRPYTSREVTEYEGSRPDSDPTPRKEEDGDVGAHTHVWRHGYVFVERPRSKSVVPPDHLHLHRLPWVGSESRRESRGEGRKERVGEYTRVVGNPQLRPQRWGRLPSSEEYGRKTRGSRLV